MGRPKTSYSREELIAICEKAIVPQSDWCDRDSEKAQCQVGECWALLRAGCDFDVLYDPAQGGCSTDARTIWLQTYSEGFEYFEYSEPGDDEPARRSFMRTGTHYLPTPKRLAESAGKDWY